jgi:hypothetical protein
MEKIKIAELDIDSKKLVKGLVATKSEIVSLLVSEMVLK